MNKDPDETDCETFVSSIWILDYLAALLNIQSRSSEIKECFCQTEHKKRPDFLLDVS